MKTKKSKASLVVDKIPSTGREAFKILDTMLSDEEKKRAPWLNHDRYSR